jgi:hypothetical protein
MHLRFGTWNVRSLYRAVTRKVQNGFGRSIGSEWQLRIRELYLIL